ncbi:hypothetical protein Tco_0936566 [Tanacetum coccineum]
MVACLEKSDENAEFHQIVDFLSTCSIIYALIVSPTIYASYIEQFWNTATSKIINSVKQIHAIVDRKAVVISESSVRSCNITPLFASMLVQTQAPKGEGSAVHPEPQPTPSTSQPNVSEPQIASLPIETSLTAAPQTKAHQTAGMDTGGSPRCQETMGGTPGQTRSERVLAQPNEPPLSEGHTSRSREGRMKHTFELTGNVPSTPHDSPLPGGYTPGSDEGRMKLDELITLCTKLSKQVLDLENKKDAQAVEILNLKRRGRRSDKLKPMFNDKDFEELDNYIENVKEETVDAAATRVSTVSAPVSTAGVTISTAEPRTPSTTTTVFDDEDVTIAMAQTLIKIKGQKAKEKGVAITDVEDSSRIDVAEEQESPKSDEEAAIDYEHEKEELRMWLTAVLDEEETVDPKILSAKYPIVDWESHNLRNVDMEDLHVYKIIRADGNTSYHKSLSSIHMIFDKQDLVNLHRLVMKRFEDTTLEGMAVHLDKEFYPHFLTTIAGQRWILNRGLGLMGWLVASIDHGKAGTGLTDVAAYDPSVEANYLSVMSALRAMNFPILSQLESHKDANIADIMGLLHLEGSAADVTPRQGGNARRDKKGNYHNTLASIRETKTCIKYKV